MSNLYSRVYHLPERLDRAREKQAQLQTRLAGAFSSEKYRIRAQIRRHQAALAVLEKEARDYGFTDLLTQQEQAA